MDPQAQRARSPSTGHHQSQSPLINQSQMPSSGPYPTGDPSSLGLNIGFDQQLQQQQQQHQHHHQHQRQHSQPSFANATAADQVIFDPINPFPQQQSISGPGSTLAFNANSQSGYLSPDLGDSDFSLFPPSGAQGDQFNTPLFDQANTLNPGDMANMNSPQLHHSPTPPHLLQPDAHHPGSAHQSPSFNQHQFSSPPSSHSRHASLGPEAALLPNHMGEWNQPQFQRHRRTPSEYSDVSSVAPSPNLVTADSFDMEHPGHSPMQRPSDGGLYQEVLGIGSFTLSDPNSPGHPGHSPSHSPAISPRIIPAQMPDISQPGFGLSAPNHADYGVPAPYGMQAPNEAFPTLQNPGGPDVSQMAPPAINIDFAPSNTKIGNFEPKSQMDQDSLTPPERGRQRGRQRAVTDPFHTGGGLIGRPGSSSGLSNLGSDLSNRSDTSRSLSPLDRQATSPSRRRQSTSAVPNRAAVLRLVGPEYNDSQEPGQKRAQKHPATFQCTLCPKRFTRAYNLRSHLRTHTDERPFVCTVCGKAFARQHDRKRHESLHSGEKKFVCKGDLKAGGQWGCGRRFARADALGRHFRSEAGRICIKQLLDEEMIERQRQWQEQRMHQNMAQNLNAQGAMAMDPNAAYPMDASGNYALPAALLAQYPALAQMNWSATDMGGGMDDDLSGRSSFDASDYDDGDDGGYVSGPGTGFGDGGMGQNFGDMGYASDFGGR